MDCVRCNRPALEHAPPNMLCPDGSGGDFTFLITKELVEGLEIVSTNMKRIAAGEKFQHCPFCLREAPLVTCICGMTVCEGHLAEHKTRCVPPADVDREPTPEEYARANDIVGHCNPEQAQRLADYTRDLIALDSLVAQGLVVGPRAKVPQCKAILWVLERAGFRPNPDNPGKSLFAPQDPPPTVTP